MSRPEKSKPKISSESMQASTCIESQTESLKLEIKRWTGLVLQTLVQLRVKFMLKSTVSMWDLGFYSESCSEKLYKRTSMNSIITKQQDMELILWILTGGVIQTQIKITTVSR